MQVEAEAPATEPLSFETVTRRFGALTALDARSSLAGSGRGRGARRGRPIGLRQVDTARAGGRAPGARRRGHARAGGRHAPPSAARPAPTCPSATCCCPGATRSATPPSRSSARACRGPRRAGAPSRSSSASAWRSSSARAPAALSGGMRQRVAFLRTLLAGRPGAAARRALRRARRDHARGPAGVAGRRARRRAADGGAGDPRRRGGGLPGRPGGRALAPSRAASSPSSRSTLPRPRSRDRSRARRAQGRGPWRR